MDRIVLLGAAHKAFIDESREITLGCTFLYEQEIRLENVLLEAFAKMSFVIRQFRSTQEALIASGTPELDNYIAQLNQLDGSAPKNFIVELHAVDLSTYFKSFLLLAKAVLDKLVPLYSYRFYENLKQFSDKGVRLIRLIKNNKHIGKKGELTALIERAKLEWIDTLIDLRDEYAHYSNLRGYINFWIPGETIGKREFTGMPDFCKPSVVIGEKQIEALVYLLDVKAKLIQFLQSFLQLCEFTPGRRPKHYLKCECGFTFANKPTSGPNAGRLVIPSALEIQVIDRATDYGVIICPKCGLRTETDLQYWRREGGSFFDPKATQH